MDWLEKKENILLYLKKYRGAALVLLIGLMFMLFPGEAQENEKIQQKESLPEITFQQELENLLSRLDGAGKVAVLLSQEQGSQTHYQMNEDHTETSDTLDHRNETVVLTDADRSQRGLVFRIDPPVYLGAVVLCQGADNPSVKLAVVDAVAAATGLTSDKISVWKMK